MKSSAILREVKRDLTTGNARTGLYFVIYAVLIGLLVLHEMTSVTALLDSASKYQTAGANVRVVVADGRIDGRACESLARQYALDSAAVRSIPGQIHATLLKSVPLAQYAATPRIAEVLGATDDAGKPIRSAGALVGAPVLEEFGHQSHSIHTDLGNISIAGSYPYPDDGRRGGLGFAAIFPEPIQDTPYDECWLRSWPEYPGANALLNSVVLPASGTEKTQPQLSQLNTSLGRSFAGNDLFNARATRFDFQGAMLIGGVVGFIAIRTRKLELASARHAGATMLDALRIQLLQQGAWILLASMLVVAVAFVASDQYAYARTNLIEIVLRIALSGAIGAIAGIAVAVSTVRERSLFAYFKQRE